ncbi:hypothetical protein KR074_009501 [Drosophila pseudoananassae]|nr:hypothetical protein KR074_009501 [Drosophila pseudoananassae]
MSIVLDVVQRMVLQKAYDLTCEAAICALRRYTYPKHVKGGNHKLLKPGPPPKRVSSSPPEVVATPLVKPKAPAVRKVIRYEGRDMPRTNSGLIDPPQCSCMRICRDSYFS